MSAHRVGMVGVILVVLVGRAAPVAADHLRDLQTEAVASGRASWGHWGPDPSRYSSWRSHSNRLVPVYTFGFSLRAFAGSHSPYRDPARLKQIYGRAPEGTHDPAAEYFDQTDLYRLQCSAIAAGKKHIVLVIFDGMDWQTTWAAAIAESNRVSYREGRGQGLEFQDYRGTETDFGYMVTSPHNHGTLYDADAQVVINRGGLLGGGYDWRLGGATPWERPADPEYLIGRSSQRKHAYTDSASSATSMTAGIKTYNAAINVDADGKQVVPLARELQRQGFAIGVVTNVPISHATPAAAYANNVSRGDYQDLTRDLLGLPSVAHKSQALDGVEVLLGAGWGEEELADAAQGSNFVPGNRYLTADDAARLDGASGGRYRVVQRTSGAAGAPALAAAARRAAAGGQRLFGFFGVAATGHLPFQTADGGYDPAPGVSQPAESYSEADICENPTLADMTSAALVVLEKNPHGFWLMVEAGDVDWANHDNNLDNSIGAVKSGDEAFRAIVDWVEAGNRWHDTVVIVTADHGHYLVLDQPEALLAPASSP